MFYSRCGREFSQAVHYCNGQKDLQEVFNFFVNGSYGSWWMNRLHSSYKLKKSKLFIGANCEVVIKVSDDRSRVALKKITKRAVFKLSKIDDQWHVDKRERRTQINNHCKVYKEYHFDNDIRKNFREAKRECLLYDQLSILSSFLKCNEFLGNYFACNDFHQLLSCTFMDNGVKMEVKLRKDFTFSIKKYEPGITYKLCKENKGDYCLHWENRTHLKGFVTNLNYLVSQKQEFKEVWQYLYKNYRGIKKIVKYDSEERFLIETKTSKVEIRKFPIKSVKVKITFADKSFYKFKRANECWQYEQYLPLECK